MSTKLDRLNHELNSKQSTKEPAPTIQIVAILDRSASMNRMKDEIISSFNEFITEQKKEPGEAELSLVLFDTHIEESFTKIPIDQVPQMDGSVYRPQGLTALYDAIGQTITRFDADENVVMLIQTDGQNNASRVYDQFKVKSMIEEKIAEGWDINFLGADIDVRAESGKIGVTSDKAIVFDKSAHGINVAYKSMSNTTSLYRNEVFERGLNNE